MCVCSSTLTTGSQTKVNWMSDRSGHFCTALLQLLPSSSIKEVRTEFALRSDLPDLGNFQKHKDKELSDECYGVYLPPLGSYNILLDWKPSPICLCLSILCYMTVNEKRSKKIICGWQAILLWAALWVYRAVQPPAVCLCRSYRWVWQWCVLSGPPAVHMPHTGF